MPRRAAVIGATLVVLLLATWAASVGPQEVLRGDGPERAAELDREEPPDEKPDGTREPGTASATDRSSTWVGVLSAIVQLLCVALLGYAVVSIVRRGRRPRWWHRRAAPDPPPDADFEVLEPQRTAEALVADAGLQMAMLLEGEPRNAIVACWHRFEVQASSVGLAREPWETSSEFTLRLLDLVSADPAAVAELAGLYREARFSDHDVDETSRARAVAALDVLHGGMRHRLESGVDAL